MLQPLYAQKRDSVSTVPVTSTQLQGIICTILHTFLQSVNMLATYCQAPFLGQTPNYSSVTVNAAFPNFTAHRHCTFTSPFVLISIYSLVWGNTTVFSALSPYTETYNTQNCKRFKPQHTRWHNILYTLIMSPIHYICTITHTLMEVHWYLALTPLTYD